jgi:glycosyltransferase involved in cell wall biosynthesis
VRPSVFAYPFGDHDPAVVELVRGEGIEIALTTLAGHNRVPLADPLRLRRTNVNPRGARLLALRLLPVAEPLDRWRQKRRAARQRTETDRGAAARARSGYATAPANSANATAGPDEGARRGPTPDPAPIAYVMSRFPKLTETFVLYELAALEAMGAAVEIFPLLRERAPVAHPEAEQWARRAHYHPFLSVPILRSQLHFLRADPKRYLGLLLEVLRRTLGSANFFFGALGIFPKAAHFAREMQLRRVRHLHAHFASHPAAAAFIVHRLTGIPYSFTAHGSDLHVERRMLDAKVAKAAFVVTVSEYNREMIVGECGEAARGKVHVVHCGVDSSVFAESAPQLSPRDRKVNLVCVASFEEVKGHVHLVEACRILRDLGWRIRCQLIGEGPLRREIEMSVARAELEDVFVFHGGLPRPQVARLVSIADVAVLASQQTRSGKREGIPVALMEAMAAGLPVVASRLSGIPELVDHKVSGVLVPPADPLALAGAIAFLAENPETRARMGQAGREKVRNEFDLQRNARKLLALILGEPATEPKPGDTKRPTRRKRRGRVSTSEQAEARP